MDEKVKITLGTSLMLSGAIENLLKEKTTNENGEVLIIDRNIPFRMRYRLIRTLTALERDMKFLNEQKIIALQKFGVADESEGIMKLTTEEAINNYKNYLYNILNTEVEHYIRPCEVEDILEVTDSVPMSDDALRVFIYYMTNDPTYKVDLLEKIEAPTTEESTVKEKETKEALSKEEEVTKKSRKRKPKTSV